MKLYLARHDRTDYNDLGFCNVDSNVDVHLTPVGIAQAEALAKRLQDAPFGCIYASQLKRTQQTAEIINKSHRLNIEIDPRLNDGRTGFEGKYYLEYENALDTAADRWTARFNDGESVEDIKQRAAAFIGGLRTRPVRCGPGRDLAVDSICHRRHRAAPQQRRSLAPRSRAGQLHRAGDLAPTSF